MKLNLLIILLLLGSCSIPIKMKEKQPDTTEDKAIALPLVETSPDNWADEYYYKTHFILKDPKIVEDYNGIVQACKSKDKYFRVDYQNKDRFRVMYKETPLNVKTKSGFSKVVFVTKGACREFSLYKSNKINPKKQIRRSIKQMELIYVYNHGTYLKSVLFRTSHKDVQFLVE